MIGQRYPPGLALRRTQTLAATLIRRVELSFFGQPHLEALVITILLGLPFLIPVLKMSLTRYGVLTVYAVPPELAATLPVGAPSNPVGTVVKLVRALMLGGFSPELIHGLRVS